MYENVKKVEQEGAIGRGIGFLKGALVAAIFTAVVFFVFALLLSYTPMGEEAIPYIALITEGAGAGIAGFFAAKRAGRSGALTGVLCALFYVLIIWLIASVTVDAMFFAPHIFILAGISVLTGAAGGILGVNLKSNNKKKR